MEPADGLRQLLSESNIDLESMRARQLLEYLALLKKWNHAINLTAATEWPALKPLFMEGTWAAKIYSAEAVFHLDIGSGAGFPAIILRILLPRIRLEMVESRIKKCVFLERAGKRLGLSGMRVHPERLNVFLSRCRPNKTWDCVTWKGLKLGSEDIRKLASHAHADTQFWMFHGREPAIEEPELLESLFRKLRSERLPERREWNLSVYVPR
jgi:16S rRNA (guanine(527)-N(7))-methyltransferase RsmG